MSTFKKVVSLMLCFAMLFSTVAIVGNSLVASEAAAAESGEPVSGIDSYADLAAKYDNFIYLGLEFYEKNAEGDYTLTDYKVQPGQELKMYFYLKTDMYLGSGAPYIIFERAFFDVTNGATNLTYDDTYDPDHADYPTENYPAVFEGTMNPNHSAVKDAGVTVTMTTKWARNINGFTEKTATNWHGVDLAESDTWDFIFGSWGRDATGLTSWEAKDDAYYYDYTLKVREFMPDGVTKLADGTTGFVKNDHRLFKRYDASTVTSKRVSNIAVAETQLNYGQIPANNKADYLTLENILIDDCNHTFTIDSTSTPGEYDTPEEEVVVPVSGIDSYADLADKYDNFVYLGLEFYEKNAEGDYTLTDYKVQPGQELKMYFYLKTDMYLGSGAPYIIFERAFFDVTNGATNLTYDDTYDPDHADYPTENYPAVFAGTMNPNHSAVTTAGVTVTMTTKWARNINGFTEKTATNWHGVDLAESDTWDFVFGSWGRDATGLTSWEAKDDAYYYDYTLKVREFMPDGVTKLADGTTGFVKNDHRLFKRYDASTVTSKRVSNIAVAETQLNYGQIPANNKADYLTIDSFLIDDCSHTFTIDSTSTPGEYGSGTAVKKYSVTFVENDGSTISTDSYEAGAEVTVPAAAENELGWANTKTGVIDETIVSGEKLTVGKANVTYQRVLSTDEFDVTLNLDGGTIDGETSVVVKAGYGEEVNLNDYIPEKTGYTASWDPSTITVENINGASAKVTWTANTYKVIFYADSEGTVVHEEVTATYNTNLAAKTKPVKEGYEFAGWVDAEGNMASPSAGALGVGRFTKTEDTNYYPSWTQLPCSITVKTQDFLTGEWKTIEVKYGKEDAVAYSKDAFATLKAGLDNSEAYGWDGDVYYDPATASAKIGTDEATATTIGRNDAIKFSGHQIVYIIAEPILAVEYNIPVYDEAAGEYTDRYETFTATTRPSVSANVIVPVSSTTPVEGFNFLGWKTANGEDATYSTGASNYTFPVSLEGGAKIVVYAEFALKTYDLQFRVGDEYDSTATVIIKGGFKIGDTVDLSTAEFVYKTPASKAGQTAVMPVVGKVNDEQPIRFTGRDGYKFLGFYYSKDNSKTLVDFDGLVITEELISQYGATSGDYISILGEWEAQSYTATFKYETADSTADAPKYETIEVTVPVGTALKDFNPYSDAEIKATIDAATPEGHKFSRWNYDKTLSSTGAMIAGGLEYTAIYDKLSITVYVDYNNGGVPQSLETVKYGDDTMAVGDEYGEGRGIYYVVKTIQLDAYRPTETHESIGWTAYHVHDDADVNDPSKWIKGVNCDGTSEAKTTIIYKNEWKQHGEFLITLYGTDGKIYCGLGKNFKLYYWETRRACSRDEATLVHNPELLILFLKPEFVKDESGLCLKLTPFALNRSLFTFSNIGALFEALGTLIGSAIRGEL